MPFVDSTFPIGDAIDFDDDLNNYRNLQWLKTSPYLYWSRMQETYSTAEGFSLWGAAGARPDDIE